MRINSNRKPRLGRSQSILLKEPNNCCRLMDDNMSRVLPFPAIADIPGAAEDNFIEENWFKTRHVMLEDGLPAFLLPKSPRNLCCESPSQIICVSCTWLGVTAHVRGFGRRTCAIGSCRCLPQEAWTPSGEDYHTCKKPATPQQPGHVQATKSTQATRPFLIVGSAQANQQPKTD